MDDLNKELLSIEKEADELLQDLTSKTVTCWKCGVDGDMTGEFARAPSGWTRIDIGVAGEYGYCHHKTMVLCLECSNAIKALFGKED